MIKLAALTYVMRSLGPVGWLVAVLVGAFAVATLLAFWPIVLVASIVVGTLYVARRIGRGY